MNRILIIEDELNLGKTLSDRLGRDGFQVTWVKNQKDAFNTDVREYDLVLMDVELPDGNGFEIAKKYRDLSPRTAVMFLTAAASPEERIQGLEIGAEDYLVKPFHIQELLLRIKKILSRSSSLATPTQDTIHIGQAEISFKNYSIKSRVGDAALTHKECALLKLLVDRRGEVVSRDEILDQIWSQDEYPTPRTIDNFVLRLRRWIEPEPEQPIYIRSVRGVGYVLEKEST